MMLERFANGSIGAKGGRHETARIGDDTRLEILNLNSFNHIFKIVVRENIEQPRRRSKAGRCTRLRIALLLHVVDVALNFLASDEDDVLDAPVGRNAFEKHGRLGTLSAILLVVPRVQGLGFKVKQVVGFRVPIIREAMFENVVSHRWDGVVPTREMRAGERSSFLRPSHIDATSRLANVAKATREKRKAGHPQVREEKSWSPTS